MQIQGRPQNVEIAEKRKGDRSFYKVSFVLEDLEGKYACYLWADHREDLPDLTKNVTAVVKKVTKGELLLKITESSTSTSTAASNYQPPFDDIQEVEDEDV